MKASFALCLAFIAIAVIGTLVSAIAINTPRELKLARKWMSQGRPVDLPSLTDTSKALA